MSKKIAVITIPSIAVLIVLFFFPISEFLENNSNNEESPSPIMILENSDDILSELKITPIGCSETTTGLTESHFQITNTNENDYEVNVGVSFTDNDTVLYEKQIKLKVLSGQIVNQNHQSDDVYDNPVCVVQIMDYSEI